jgi:hypothetical protein
MRYEVGWKKVYLFCRIRLEENCLDRLHFEREEEITTNL